MHALNCLLFRFSGSDKCDLSFIRMIRSRGPCAGHPNVRDANIRWSRTRDAPVEAAQCTEFIRRGQRVTAWLPSEALRSQAPTAKELV